MCFIARQTPDEKGILRIEARIQELIRAIGDRKIDWGALTVKWNPKAIEKAVVLKRYVSDHEPGVVLISFEYQWTRLMGMANLAEFARRYTLVVATSSTPPHALGTTLFMHQYPGERVFALLSNPADVKTLPRLSPKIRAVPLYASNWIDPDLYHPLPFPEKDIDIAMIAGFGRVKRHFALFRALRKMPRDVRVVMVGQPMGMTAADILAMAGQYGVRDRIKLVESVPFEEVGRWLARAKISLVLSRREGSSTVVMESMFADTPVGIYEDARIGSRVFINEQTGRFLRHEDLGKQLLDFLANAGRYSARERALRDRLCCHGSTAVLNRELKESALAEGKAWTEDIAVHRWTPDPQLLPAHRERLNEAYQDLRQRFGVTLGTQ